MVHSGTQQARQSTFRAVGLASLPACPAVRAFGRSFVRQPVRPPARLCVRWVVRLSVRPFVHSCDRARSGVEEKLFFSSSCSCSLPSVRLSRRRCIRTFGEHCSNRGGGEASPVFSASACPAPLRLRCLMFILRICKKSTWRTRKQ